jgi:hypothetical protein
MTCDSATTTGNKGGYRRKLSKRERQRQRERERVREQQQEQEQEQEHKTKYFHKIQLYSTTILSKLKYSIAIAKK